MPDDMRVRRLTLEVFTRVRDGWKFATDILADIFRREYDLGEPERAVVVAASKDMIRFASKIDYALEHGGMGPGDRTADLARYLTARLWQGDIGIDEAVKYAPRFDWKKVLAIEAAIDAIPNPARRFALRHAIPEWLATRVLSQYGESADPLFRALNQTAPRTLRANLLKGDRDALVGALADEGVAATKERWSPTALSVPLTVGIFRTRAFYAGLFEVQDEASQLCIETVLAPPKGKVVETCAGAGGKSLGIAAAMRGKGTILALDIAESKLADLRERARRAGAFQIQAQATVPDSWSEEHAKRIAAADRVLIDAPCSGTGSWRRKPEGKWQLDPEDVDRLKAVQADLLRRAAALIAPGARIIYATCSLLREENEAQVESLLGERADLELVRLAELWGAERAAPLADPSGAYLVPAPDRHGTDGFFAAVLRKKR